MGNEDPVTGAKAKTRILVVEDVPNVATVLEARLASFGYEVCDIVSTGPAAIQSALDHHPDIILMDIMLDGEMNGIEAAGKINAKMDVPIIYLSCLNDQAVLEGALKTHPYGFIMKPYDKDELRFSIENALDKFLYIQQRDQRIADLEDDDDRLE